MKLPISFSAITLALLLTSCNSETNHSPESTQSQQSPKTATVKEADVKKSDEELIKLYQEATKILFKARALSATLYGLSTEEVGTYYADKMENYSPESEKTLRNELLSLSEKIQNHALRSNKQSDLDTQQVMHSLTRYFAGHPDFSIGYIDPWMGLSPFVVNQINGPLIDIPRYMQSDQQVTNEKDALDYIARLGKFDEMVSSIQAKLLSDAEQNWIAPKVNLKGAIRYFDSFLKSEPTNHPLVISLSEKLQKIDAMSADRKQSLVQMAQKNVANVVYPAYQAISAQTKLLMEKAPQESGIWAQPNGDKFYQDAIHQLGDSRLTADEIHNIGLKEVIRITKEMDNILQAQDYKEGTVGERMIAITDESRFLYPDSKKGREALLDDINGFITEVNLKMAALFKTKPRYKVEVRAFPVEIQDGASGGQYTPPSVDGSKPGIYWINLRDMKAVPKFSLKTLTYHEANPGHHWQISLNMAQDELPFLRRIAPYNAYTEGWALYSEKVAEEMGLYENDPFSNLGRLQAEIFRAVRLVVDTGLHHKRWTREQAIKYMIEKTGSAESDVTAEIERYMTWPGQALGYKLGMLKILELREKSRKALGENFDLATFHDLILLGGAVPMKVLDAKVSQWITHQLETKKTRHVH